jgi:hypothetical protein
MTSHTLGSLLSTNEMRLTRKNRLITALYTLLSLLFMQLAVSAYACSGVPSNDMGGSVQSMSGMDQTGCQKLNQDQGNLCKSHCEKSSQSVDSVSHATPDAPALPLLTVTPRLDAHLPSASGLQGAQFAAIPAQPPSLRFCVLRI